MIIRIVKLTIDPSKISEFEAVFVANQDKIRAFEGCHHVEVLRDVSFPNLFFTYSHWDSLEALENYRKSDMFKGIWSSAKKTFCAKPEAWSLRK